MITLLRIVIIIAICTLATVVKPVGIVNGAVVTQDISDNVEHFLNNPHGLTRLAPEELELIDQMKIYSDQYIPAITPVLQFDPSTVEIHERALILLGMIGGDRARAAIFADYRNMSMRFLTEPPENAPLLLGLRRLALSELGKLGGTEAVADVLDEIELTDTPTQVAMMNYLMRVGVRNATVINRLEGLLSNPQSRLANNPSIRLADAIRAIRQGI